MRHARIALGLSVVALIVLGALYLSATGLLPTLAEVRAERLTIETFLVEAPVLGVLIYLGVYIVTAMLALPLVALLSVLGGFLFGSVLGTVLVVTAATIGATMIFVLVRYFFRPAAEAWFGPRLQSLDAALTGHGFRDVFLLRLIPLIPFAVINAGMALTGVRLRDYVLATFLGIIPFTFVYVNAGTQLADVQSVEDIVSFPVVGAVSLVVLASLVSLHVKRGRTKKAATSLPRASVE